MTNPINASSSLQSFFYTQLTGMYTDIIQPVENSVKTVIKSFKDSKLPQSTKEVTYDKVIDIATRGVFFIGGAYCLYKPLYNVGRHFGGCLGIIGCFFLSYVGFRFVDKNVNRFVALSSCLYQGSDLFFRGESLLQCRLGGTLLVVTTLYLLNYPKPVQETPPTQTNEFESLNLADKLSEQLNRLASKILRKDTPPASTPPNPCDTSQ